jgi:hypothetical protein
MSNSKKVEKPTELQFMKNDPEKGAIKFRSSLSYIIKLEEQEVKSSMEPSQTVPDMTLSLQELVERYTRGQSVATFTPVYYGEDEEFADVSRMDPIERIEYARFIREKISETRTSLAEQTRAEGREPQTSDGQNFVEEKTEQNGLL